MGILKAGRPSGRTKEHVENNLKHLAGEKRLNVKMSITEYEKLRTLCFEEKTSISNFIRNLIDQKKIKSTSLGE